MTRFSLSEIMAISLRAPVADPDQAKLHQRLLEKSKYCKDVLVTIVSAAQAQTSPEPESAAPFAPANSMHTLTSRTSKMSLR